jgi:hypothetical protein
MTDYRSLEQKYRHMVEARNSELRKKIHNVARPDDPVPTDPAQKLSKQAEIKKKIIDEAADDQDVDNKKKKNDSDNSKDSATKEMDPKKLTGGKTEVDLKPTTDDRPEDTTREDEVGKKARKDENKKIGAKGVKEETMTTKNFGLSDALIQTVNEVLKGNQHKLDKNHNGKIDAQDFKLLKGKKKMEEDKECGCKGNCQCSTNEEVEQIDEKDMGNKKLEINSSGGYVSGGHPKFFNRYITHMKPKKMNNINDAPANMKNKMAKEEVEQIDELSTKTLTSYMDKSKKQRDSANTDAATKAKRTSGYNTALNKDIQKEEVVLSADELARIEEIAKGL